jgi:hypothetical protein
MSLLSPSKIITNQCPEIFHDHFRSFFARFCVYAVIFAGLSSSSDYCLLGGLRVLAQTTAHEVRLAFILLSFVVLICIHNLVYFYSLPTLTPHSAHTAAAEVQLSQIITENAP